MTRIGSLCTGTGALDRAAQAVTGGRLAWVSDPDPGATALLAHHYPEVPNHGDLTAVDWATVEPADILTAGFPCQDVSSAGRRAGLRDGNRTGLWLRIVDIIDQLRPSLVVLENVRGLLSADADSAMEPCPWCVGDGPGSGLRALGAVLGDLADLGFDAEWQMRPASADGAPHRRERVFIVAAPAHADGIGHERPWDARGRRTRLADRGSLVADTAASGRRAQLRSVCRTCGQPLGSEQTVPGRRDGVAANTSSVGRGEGRPESTWLVGGSDAAECGDDAPYVNGDGIDWGVYQPAIDRWSAVVGRPAPAPTFLGKRGGRQLSPWFVEWLMGLPAGHVCDVPELSRNQMLKLLGNGVVVQQATAALRSLLPLLAPSEVAA